MAEILMMIPYGKLFPPRNGGALRCFFLLREIARYHQVHCILLQSPRELYQDADGYVFPDSVKVYSPVEIPPPTTVFSYLPKRIGVFLHYRWLRRQWRGPANSFLLKTHHLISYILERHHIEAVIYEHLSAMMTAPYVKRIATGKVVGILDAHNVEHVLLTQDMKERGSTPAAAYKQTYWYESNLSQYVDTFFACSEDDLRLLEKMNRKQISSFLIPNGVDTQFNQLDETPYHVGQDIIFCGSLDWPPNKDGLLWFYTKVWPLIQKIRPATRLIVVGRGAEGELAASLRSDPTVNLIGFVPDVRPYYRQSSVAIVPLHSGSGTRLKILESMSLGNPIVSTRLGAQGIDAVDGQSIVYADEPEAFADAVVQLLTDPALFDGLRHEARALVESRYDWQVVGRQANAALERTLDSCMR